MLLLILDFLSYITIGLLTIPAWISFLFESFSGLGDRLGMP